MNTNWRDMPPGAARQAARASYYRDRSKPISADCPVRKVSIDGKTGVRGPSRITHYYNSEAQERIAERLARTRAQPFPDDLLATEFVDGQLIVSCKTKPRKLVIPPELPPNFLAITIDHLSEAEQQHRAAQVNTNAGNVPETEREEYVRSER